MAPSGHRVDPSGLRDVPRVALFVATGCYTGLIPWASGTFGSLLGLCIALIPGIWSPVFLLPLTLIGFWAGLVSSRPVVAAVGHRLTAIAALTKSAFQGTHSHGPADPSMVVIDEIVGMWVTLLFVPFSWPAAAFGFVAFRAMDILKPEPARHLERLPNGWGIMLDDLVAGLYANLLCQLFSRLVLPG